MPNHSPATEHFLVDVAVIGAGVVGCAIARQFAKKQKSVMVLEAGPRIGEGVTSRNSGVIHAGIYYHPTSLKASACVRGKALLYEHCDRLHVPYRKTGKLIVALDGAETAALEQLHANAHASGATEVSLLSGAEAKKLEPSLPAVAALYSPATGIVDPYELTRSLLVEAEADGAILATQSGVNGIRRETDGSYTIETMRGPVQAEVVINCAGLHADEIARFVGIDKYKIHPCRGDYFSFRPRHSYQHLIYPVIAKGSPGLGVHLTIDLGGRYRLGPDAEFVDTKSDFSAAPEKLEKFRLAAERLFGAIEADQLAYDSCGIRPKLRHPSESVEKDFVVSEDLPGFLNMVGIESPGLTSALALAELADQALSR